MSFFARMYGLSDYILPHPVFFEKRPQTLRRRQCSGSVWRIDFEEKEPYVGRKFGGLSLFQFLPVEILSVHGQNLLGFSRLSGSEETNLGRAEGIDQITVGLTDIFSRPIPCNSHKILPADEYQPPDRSDFIQF